MKVRWSIVLLALLGVIAALAAAVLTASLSASQIQAVMPSSEPVDVTILVAAKDIKATATVDADSIVEKVVSEEDVPESYFSDPAQIIGKTLSLPLIEGQAFSVGGFPRDGSALMLASKIPAGKRAVNISLSDYSGLEGIIYPGCTVDVLASFKVSASSKYGKAVSTTLLQNIPVLGVENITIVSNSELEDTAKKNKSSFKNETLITLMVDSRQAEALQLAMEHGTISLALRNPADTVVFESDPTLLSEGVLAQLADVLAPTVLEEPQRVSGADAFEGEFELAALEPGVEDQGSSEVATAATDAKKAVTSSREQAFWRIDILRGLTSETRSFPVAN